MQDGQDWCHRQCDGIAAAVQLHVYLELKVVIGARRWTRNLAIQQISPLLACVGERACARTSGAPV
eukprot:6227593-Prymnesium_polylepis.2